MGMWIYVGKDKRGKRRLSGGGVRYIQGQQHIPPIENKVRRGEKNWICDGSVRSCRERGSETQNIMTLLFMAIQREYSNKHPITA